MLTRRARALETRSVSRRRFLASASVAALALAGRTSRARAQSAVTLRISSSLPAGQNAAHYPWYQRFAANLQGAIGNSVAIDYFPNSQLGKEADVVQQVKVGSIDMMITGSSIWATVAPEFGMLDLGYVFDSYAHVARRLTAGSASVWPGYFSNAPDARYWAGRRTSARAASTPGTRSSRLRM